MFMTLFTILCPKPGTCPKKCLIVLQTIIPSVIMFGMPYVSFPLPQNSMERDHPSHNSDTDIYRSTLQSRHQHYHCHRLTNNAR